MVWPVESQPTRVVDLATVAEGEAIAGPVLVDCLGTVAAIPPGWTAHRDDTDSLLWKRQ